MTEIDFVNVPLHKDDLAYNEPFSFARPSGTAFIPILPTASVSESSDTARQHFGNVLEFEVLRTNHSRADP